MVFLKQDCCKAVLLANLKDNFGFEASESFDVELENVDSLIDRHWMETGIVDC